MPEAAEIVWDGRLAKIHMLRLEFAPHNVGYGDEKKAAKHQRIVGEIFAEFTGLFHLRDDDAPMWGRLQAGLMGELAAMLDDLLRALNTAPPPPTREEFVAVGFS